MSKKCGKLIQDKKIKSVAINSFRFKTATEL
jgi:hypothetical protein